MTEKNKRITPYPLRLKPLLRSKLEQEAKAHGRSLNIEIAMRLENSFLNDEEEKSRVEKIVANYLKSQGLIENDKTI